jgi:hypothetical protein
MKLSRILSDALVWKDVRRNGRFFVRTLACQFWIVDQEQQVICLVEMRMNCDKNN